ncbi:4149_t:CDS:1, partial [Entrophospora sp. SA101]
SNYNIHQQITAYQDGNDVGRPIYPYELISKHFNRQPPNEKIHIIVR